jgi:hypothetical protein
MAGLLQTRLAEARVEAKPNAGHKETSAANTEPDFGVEGIRSGGSYGGEPLDDRVLCPAGQAVFDTVCLR